MKKMTSITPNPFPKADLFRLFIQIKRFAPQGIANTSHPICISPFHHHRGPSGSVSHPVDQTGLSYKMRKLLRPLYVIGSSSISSMGSTSETIRNSLEPLLV